MAYPVSGAYERGAGQVAGLGVKSRSTCRRCCAFGFGQQAIGESAATVRRIAIQMIEMPVAPEQRVCHGSISRIGCHQDDIARRNPLPIVLGPRVACAPGCHLGGRVGASSDPFDRCEAERGERLRIAIAVSPQRIGQSPSAWGSSSLCKWTITYFIAASSTVRCAAPRQASSALA